MSKTTPFRPTPANDQDNRQAFWSGMRHLAARGIDHPDSLSPGEVSALCRLVILGLTPRRTPGTRDRQAPSRD